MTTTAWMLTAGGMSSSSRDKGASSWAVQHSRHSHSSNRSSSSCQSSSRLLFSKVMQPWQQLTRHLHRGLPGAWGSRQVLVLLLVVVQQAGWHAQLMAPALHDIPHPACSSHKQLQQLLNKQQPGRLCSWQQAWAVVVLLLVLVQHSLVLVGLQGPWHSSCSRQGMACQVVHQRALQQQQQQQVMAVQQCKPGEQQLQLPLLQV